MRTIFMGTPDFAVHALDALVEAGHEVVMAVTQPDRERGRGRKVTCSPVKECALSHEIPVRQPERVKEPTFVEELQALHPDVIVVVAFGQILSEDILRIPKYGCINVHASLLPAYRGAAPIQWAVIDGLAETGVTTMYMDKGLDTGDIICQSKVTLSPDETGGSLFERLAKEGASLLIRTLSMLEDGTAVRTAQDASKATYAKMLTKQMGELRFADDAKQLEQLIRGLNPWPSAYTKLNGKTLKIFGAQAIREEDAPKGVLPGTVYGVDRTCFSVRCQNGALRITNVQLEGKKRMDVSDFLRGYAVLDGTKLGE